MGACDFYTKAKGKTANEAFQSAREQAGHESGYGGYSGTIVEKHEFTMIEVPVGKDSYVHAYDLIEEGDERISDKWGPAGCIDCGNGEYLFFGVASS